MVLLVATSDSNYTVGVFNNCSFAIDDSDVVVGHFGFDTSDEFTHYFVFASYDFVVFELYTLCFDAILAAVDSIVVEFRRVEESFCWDTTNV